MATTRAKTVTRKPLPGATGASVPAKPHKEQATLDGLPWVEVISVDLDPDNIGNGSFELDWNDIFVAKLVRAGYQGKEDNDIVDNWFKTICRNVITEEYEQWEANQPMEERPRVIARKPLADGRSELS
jgi:hypothetical protein